METRLCARPACAAAASAVLTYNYGTATVWLLDLDPSGRHPGTHELCPVHADATRVPLGWTLDDRRRPAGGQQSLAS